MNRNRIFGLMLALALLAGAVSFTAPAEAISAGGEGTLADSTIFYSDDSYTVEVGERGFNCLGRFYRWGTTSPYYVHVETYC